MRLVEADSTHIPFLAEHMRPDDVRECAACGHDPFGALERSLKTSLWAITAIVDDEPHAMMGVASRNLLEGIGVPWMLGTERAYDHARDLVRYAPAIIDEMHRDFPHLENLVSADNDRALRFLRHVGFEFRSEISMVSSVPFVHFHRKAV